MLLPGGPANGVGALLLGLSISALLGWLVAHVQSPRSRTSFGLQLVLFLGYAPIIFVIVNSLPAAISNTHTALLPTLLLTTTSAVLLHCLVVQRFRHRDALELRSSTQEEQVSTYSSSSEYHEIVIAAENRAQELSYIQYRVAPYFLSTAAIKHIADLRFGEGNDDANKYVAAQLERQRAFMGLIARKTRVREIYPLDRLVQYVSTGTHSPNLWPLPVDMVVELLQNWRTAILSHPNYFVAISDKNLPLKYHVIDRSMVILHEPIGGGDKYRLNSVVFRSPQAGKNFTQDFEFVWGSIPPEWRESARIADWIESELIPTALKRQRTSSVDKQERSR